MPFSEKQKLLVKKKADFKCCRCHAIGIDIHHITPQEHDGPDTLDNAAPLCQNCHDQFGANPEKKKEIKQMRDHWYETVAKMYPSRSNSETELLGSINDKLDKVLEDHEDIATLKIDLKRLTDLSIERMTPETALGTVSNIVKASTASVYPKSIGEPKDEPSVINIRKSGYCDSCGAPLQARPSLCWNCSYPNY